jgi:ubiquinol-cytochrome c reductase iron-sulfur subunit
MIRATLVLALVFAVAAATEAARHANPAIVGWLGALTFVALAAACGLSAKRLHAPDDLTEPREPHGASHPEPLPEDVLSRRGVFGRIWGLALGAVAILGVVPFVALARRPSPSGTAWFPGARLVTPDGKPVRADELDLGGVTTVFPEGHVEAPLAATVVVKVEDGLPIAAPGREDWTPRGNVAFSKICTHAGCPVAIYRRASYQLYCPCHQSVFDVLRAGKPLSGPATRALPQLALDVDAHGYLIARGDYADHVGPDDWWSTI